MGFQPRFLPGVVFLLAGCFLMGVRLPAQEPTREAQIQAAREAKARQVQPDTLTGGERTLLRIKDDKLLERLTAGVGGWRLRMGGLETGSGFAIGPEYLRNEMGGGKVVLRASARASMSRYSLMDFELKLPRLAGGRAFVEFLGQRRDYPRMQYYGPGPDSRKTGRSNFRLEDNSADVLAGVRPFRHLRLGGFGGYLRANVGPGTDPRFVSSEQTFSPLVTPGIDQQSDFWRGGALLQFDNRDNPGGPRRGGNYYARYTHFAARRFDRYTFGRLEMEAQQYIPFFNERRVIALRARSVLSYTGAAEQVPFYLQPTLGGSDDLRGFRPFRFYDNNMIVMNAEYRWETFSGLDMAIFVDGGKVFPRRSQFNFKNLEGSVGVGLRFNVHNQVFLRIDAGFSHEGYQVWVKFNNVF